MRVGSKCLASAAGEVAEGHVVSVAWVGGGVHHYACIIMPLLVKVL